MGMIGSCLTHKRVFSVMRLPQFLWNRLTFILFSLVLFINLPMMLCLACRVACRVEPYTAPPGNLSTYARRNAAAKTPRHFYSVWNTQHDSSRMILFWFPASQEIITTGNTWTTRGGMNLCALSIFILLNMIEKWESQFTRWNFFLLRQSTIYFMTLNHVEFNSKVDSARDTNHLCSVSAVPSVHLCNVARNIRWGR